MAVFRVEKTKDYTVMANHHLRNTELSLKAKGLLSLMLSLPENWDYTTKGLSKICKDGIDSINATVKELEAMLSVGGCEIIRDSLPPPNTQSSNSHKALSIQKMNLNGKIQSWETQHRKNLSWRNLSRVNLSWNPPTN